MCNRKWIYVLLFLLGRTKAKLGKPRKRGEYVGESDCVEANFIIHLRSMDSIWIVKDKQFIDPIGRFIEQKPCASIPDFLANPFIVDHELQKVAL